MAPRGHEIEHNSLISLSSRDQKTCR